MRPMNETKGVSSCIGMIIATDVEMRCIICVDDESTATRLLGL